MLGSPVDIAIAAVVVLIVFGPKKVPELGKALGQGLGNFKRALTEGTEEFKTAINVDKEEKADGKAIPTTAANTTSSAPAQVTAASNAKEETTAPPA